MKNVLFARRVRRAMMAAALTGAILLSGCSETDRAADETTPATDSAPSETATDSEAAPASRAAPTAADRASDASTITGAEQVAATGVAFVYHMAFRLPDAQVAEAQDRHLRACERLGAQRCQVASIAYERENDGPVKAHLDLLVDPALARGFTRDAAQAVEALDGELLNSSVAGEELARGIEDSQRRSAQMGGDLARIERRLTQPGLSKNERAELMAQAQQLRSAVGGEEGGRRNSEARLASTPVRLEYSGNTGIAGLDPSRPFASAWHASTDSLSQASAFVLTIIGITLPWLLMIGGLAWAMRWLVARMRRPASATPVDSAG